MSLHLSHYRKVRDVLLLMPDQQLQFDFGDCTRAFLTADMMTWLITQAEHVEALEAENEAYKEAAFNAMGLAQALHKSNKQLRERLK